MYRRFALVAGLALAAATMLPATASAEDTKDNAATQVKVLQLNICHSGVADCYSGDDSLNKAVEVIGETKPQVLSVNEACSGDVATLKQAMGAAKAKFVAAQRSDGSAVKCENGEEYGNVIMVADEFNTGTPATGVYNDQDNGNEKRVWACLPAGKLSACTTHLSSDDGDVALKQCKALLGRATDYAQRGPVVVSGDMNLKYDGDPDVQDCNPSGFYRKGDGDLQHVFATDNLTFADGQTIDMDGTTDHPGWLVTTNLG
ncbi:MAG: endonuclease/exonuclease/phosphatase family protein [Pseudonocardiaceae bacterium]|nr:endonuclease/exonuclease/phosphatase family protein [Pseudonocardiaceae bacterium]